ncbi:MAG: hypothetical protein AAF717_04670 [Bacteroidota bacterium]
MIKSIFNNVWGLILSFILAFVAHLFFESSVTTSDNDTLYYIGMLPLEFFVYGFMVFTFLVHFSWMLLSKRPSIIPLIIFLISSALLLVTKMELYYIDMISMYCFDRSIFSFGYTIYPPLSLDLRERMLLQHNVNLNWTNVAVDTILVIGLIWASMKIKHFKK